MRRFHERRRPGAHVARPRDAARLPYALALTSILISSCTACAERIPEPVLIPTVPHVSWLIAVQTPNGQEQTVCQSDPRDECILPASTSANRTFATVHLYLHPVKSGETKYSGTMRVAFMNGAAAEPHDSKVDSTVSPGDTPTNVSVTGIVTQKPGAYTVALSLLATPATAKSLELRDTIGVTVR